MDETRKQLEKARAILQEVESAFEEDVPDFESIVRRVRLRVDDASGSEILGALKHVDEGGYLLTLDQLVDAYVQMVNREVARAIGVTDDAKTVADAEAARKAIANGAPPREATFGMYTRSGDIVVGNIIRRTASAVREGREDRQLAIDNLDVLITEAAIKHPEIHDTAVREEIGRWLAPIFERQFRQTVEVDGYTYGTRS